MTAAFLLFLTLIFATFLSDIVFLKWGISCTPFSCACCKCPESCVATVSGDRNASQNSEHIQAIDKERQEHEQSDEMSEADIARYKATGRKQSFDYCRSMRVSLSEKPEKETRWTIRLPNLKETEEVDSQV